jgi:hypothetical protein
MDEAGMRALLLEVADDQLPASTVDVTKAMAAGRARRRLRRIYLPALAPIAAATAVALIVAVAPIGIGGHTPATTSVRPTREFNPLAPYARFGWLPLGSSTLDIRQTATAEWLQATTARSGLNELQVIVHPQGRCRVSAAAGANMLLCRPAGGIRLGDSVTTVHGHPAYWTWQRLAWQYAPGSWVAISYATGKSHHLTQTQRAQVLRIAASLRFGSTARPRFGFRLSGIPAGWQPSGASFQQWQGQIYGASIALSPRASQLSSILISTFPASAQSAGCPYPGTHAHQVIDGHRFVKQHWHINGQSPTSRICSADADGMSVDIQTMISQSAASGTDLGTPADVYRHLRLLGPDVANWTTRPLG